MVSWPLLESGHMLPVSELILMVWADVQTVQVTNGSLPELSLFCWFVFCSVLFGTESPDVVRSR